MSEPTSDTASSPAADDAARVFAGLLQSGRHDDIRRLLQDAEASAHTAASFWQLGEAWTSASRFDDARRCYERAASLLPDDPRLLYNLAVALIATGEISRADQLLDRVIALDPDDADAWYNRSTLRRQTLSDNHVEALQRVLAKHQGTPLEVPLCFALAKELEDLGEYDRSFQCLARGATARRGRLSYRVAADCEAMAQIARNFDPELLGRAPAAQGRIPAPIFVLGLPRAGSTLLDRILSSHREITSLGEIPDFVLALTALLPRSDKSAVIEAASRMDFGALGDSYRQRLRSYGTATPLLIDKTPSNFLYIGLIALALPEARIVHVRRHPMDACYAILKTLFRMGYPYSYDLGDLAEYYLSYRRLMDHWRASLPGRMIEVDYESIVEDLEGTARAAVQAVGVPWDDACLSFHQNNSPAATASAAQVRQPVYSRSVGAWRHYARELEPLAARLRAGGVRID